MNEVIFQNRQIVTKIKKMNGLGKRSVFVSGNFNTLHPGHMRLLQFASECGDFLVVGVNNNNVEGILLCGEGRTFFAGADISEFGKPMHSPNLNEVIMEFENSNKPIVAVLHGTPLGGGLELAMGCNYRVALTSTMLGLPEVKLGIIPGGGGTQRLPRLAGVEKSLSMIKQSSPKST